MESQYTFREVFVDATKFGTKLPTSHYLSVGKFPIIDQGKNLIAGYSNLEEGLFQDVPAIVFGDHTRIVKYVDTPFFIGADGVKILSCKIPNANIKYLYYALQNVHIPNTGYNRHFKWLKEATIPYPNSEKQHRIVQRLDLLSSTMEKCNRLCMLLDNLVNNARRRSGI